VDAKIGATELWPTTPSQPAQVENSKTIFVTVSRSSKSTIPKKQTEHKTMNAEEIKEQSREETARLRLRAQRVEHEKSLREAGVEAGRDFVLDTEEQDDVYRQMTALARHNEHHDRPEGLADLIAAMDATDTVLMDWFHENYKRDTEEPAWLDGFVSGALEKFRQLAP
jgi:hypothetical protein